MRPRRMAWAVGGPLARALRLAEMAGAVANVLRSRATSGGDTRVTTTGDRRVSRVPE